MTLIRPADPVDLLDANGCVVTEAFAAVSARTGDGATMAELIEEVAFRGYFVTGKTIHRAFLDADGEMLVTRALDTAGEDRHRDGRQVYLPVGAS